MEQTTESLTQYLKLASELECSIYRQEEAIKEALGAIEYIEPKKRVVERPTDPTQPLKKPSEPRYIKPESNGGTIVFSAAFLVVGALAIVLCIVTIVVLGAGLPAILGLIAGIACAAFGVFGIVGMASDSSKKSEKAKEKYEAEKAQYEKDLASYEARCKEAELKKSELEEQYKAEITKAEKEYETSLAAASANYQSALDEVEAMRTPLAETKRLLDELYSNDWVYGKYRNMIAMTTMYEYFVTGRCSELTGPDGSYNLYEQEVRQNIIISQLDSINSQLEDIKANQYALYEELRKTNRLVSGVISELKDINRGVAEIRDMTGSIAKTSKTAAYYAEITAQNTEALKYIELVTQ